MKAHSTYSLGCNFPTTLTFLVRSLIFVLNGFDDFSEGGVKVVFGARMFGFESVEPFTDFGTK